METTRYCLDINVPSVDDFSTRYPQYGSFASGRGAKLFEFLVRPENIVRAMVITDFGHPAVAGVAGHLVEFVDSGAAGVLLDDYSKQFVGATMCSIMESNGYKKTGKKKAVQHPQFTRGEVYVKE